jgi:hypothetical protein
VTKYLTLSRGSQLYVALVLLVLLPLVVGIAFQDRLYGVYLEHFVRPDLEKEFGFTAGEVQVPSRAPCPPQFAIVEVSRTGVLWRAGMRPGDLPVGYVHGSATGFYSDLVRVRAGHPVEVQVLAVADYGEGLKAWRRVHLEPAGRR